MTLSSDSQLFWDLLSPELADDPYRFVMYAYPWGKPGSVLSEESGPRQWQRDELYRIRDSILDAKIGIARIGEHGTYKRAIASGRGIGKSALVAWIAHWMMSTHIGSSTIISANSEPQLQKVTWAELKKWLALAINSSWFDPLATSILPSSVLKTLMDKAGIGHGYYHIQGKLWTEENPDAYAGPHNPLGLCVIFDEASGIPAPIWNVTNGFFTEKTPYKFWFAFSNPRRREGAFYDCFHENDSSWSLNNIDAREVEGTDKSTYEEIVKKHGLDNDVTRVEVLGQFPLGGDDMFMNVAEVRESRTRELVPDPGAPLIMGVDVARSGLDSTVICFRRGYDARSIPSVTFRGADNMKVALSCADLIRQYNPDAVCVDAGAGAGVIDILRSMRLRIHEVGFGTSSSNPRYYLNKTRMYADLRDWISEGGCIADDPRLIRDLEALTWMFHGSSDKIMLVPKNKMAKSPDHSDALALTFAVHVARSNIKTYNSYGVTYPVAEGVTESFFDEINA